MPRGSPWVKPFLYLLSKAYYFKTWDYRHHGFLAKTQVKKSEAFANPTH